MRESGRSPDECDEALLPSLTEVNCAAKDVILWSKGATAAITISRIMEAISVPMAGVAGEAGVDGFVNVCVGGDAGAGDADATAGAGGEAA